MIDVIELNDWEGHKNSTLELSDNVTVILGKSHNGKSSIIRAINWVLNNSPVSTVYFPRGKKKPETSVSISTENGFISRKRNKKKNFYETDEGVFTALRSGVPDEVKDFLGMTEINLQLQKDVHFMLTDTPGKRAKRLNEVAGLSEMDNALEKVNRFHRAVKSKYDAKTLILDDFETDLKKLDWIDKAETEFEQIEKLKYIHQELTDHIDKADKAINNIETIIYQQNLLPNTEALEPIIKLKEVDDHLYNLDSEIEEIEERLKMISELKIKIKDINVPEDAVLQNLHAKNAELEVIQSNSVKLNLLIALLERLERDKMIYKQSIVEIKKEEQDFMDEFSICPFCSQSMEKI